MKIINATSDESLKQSLAGLTIVTADVRDNAVYVFAKSCEDSQKPRVIILTTRKIFHRFFDPKYPDDFSKVYAYKFSELVRYLQFNTIKETVIYNNDVYIFYNPYCYASKEVRFIATLYSTYLEVRETHPELLA